MVYKMLWLIFLYICAVNAADHNVFKNCSRIPFCANMRYQQLDQDAQFKADIESIQFDKVTAKIPLINGRGETLILQLTAYSFYTMRIQISEPNSKRYKLEYVLAEGYLPYEFAAIRNGSTLEIIPYDEDWKAVIHQGPPFYIEFYTIHGTVGPIFRGDRFMMKNSSQEYAFSIDFADAIRLYGLHHHAVDLELTDTEKTDPFRLRNSDTAGYEVGSPMALYGSVPVVYGHSASQTTGIFLHNAAEQWVDVSFKSQNPSTYFMVESASLDLFIMLGPTPESVVKQFTTLTGVAELPPVWTLGYHQCRWSYLSQEEVKDVIAQMDKHDFPMDAIWLDIDYTNGKRYFTWDPTNFSDPVEMQKNISSTGRKLVTILDPHIKVDNDYPVYVGAKGTYFVKWANGSDFEGVCWPGLSSYIDFLSPEARDYYASWYSYNKFNGSTEVLAGVWNDMNEPSVFDDTLEKTFPFELVHHGNVLHRDVHNIYGFLQTMATHQGLMKRDSNSRPFILSRSHFAGSQRYAAMWTGDNTADWPYLRVSYSECILSNLLGHVFCGADIGGFSNSPDAELLQRWYQAGVWLPFYRGHAEKTTERREPYVFPENVQKVIRNSLKLRYKHIAYFYTLFYQHTLNGEPVVRPLFYHYPDIVDTDGYILIGADILATPILQKGATNISITFPGRYPASESEKWYRIDDDSWTIYNSHSTVVLSADISTSPYFYKWGTIIMRKDIERRSTTDMVNDPYTMYVNLDQMGKGVGYLYVDDYTSFEYRKGYSAYVKITYTNPGNVKMERLYGMSFDINIEKIVVHHPPEEGHLQSSKMVFTHTSDGKPLKSIDISKMLGSGNLDLKLRI